MRRREAPLFVGHVCSVGFAFPSCHYSKGIRLYKEILTWSNWVHRMTFIGKGTTSTEIDNVSLVFRIRNSLKEMR